MKLDNTGNTIEWKRCYGGTKQDRATAVHQSADGGYIVTGYSNSEDGDVSGIHGAPTFSHDYWVVKLDNSGVLQTTKALGGLSVEDGGSSDLTIDNGLVVTGRTVSDDGDVTPAPFNGFDIWVVKLFTAHVLANSTTTVVQQVTGDTANNINNGIYKIVTLTPPSNSPNALNGTVSTTVTLQSTITNLGPGRYAVRRQYDINPASNASSAQATVKLYFTQSDFDHYNAYVQNVPLLLSGPADNTGINNLIISQVHGEFSSTTDPATATQVRPLTVTWSNNGTHRLTWCVPFS